jgi:hypothetical protein
MTAKKRQHGGARKGAGRKTAGRRAITLRIKTEILDRLEPGAAGKLRDLIEQQFEPKGTGCKPSRA